MFVADGITIRPPFAPVVFAASAAQAASRFGVLSWNAFALETVLLAAVARANEVVPPPAAIVVSRYSFVAAVGAVTGASPVSTFAAGGAPPPRPEKPSFPVATPRRAKIPRVPGRGQGGPLPSLDKKFFFAFSRSP